MGDKAPEFGFELFKVIVTANNDLFDLLPDSLLERWTWCAFILSVYFICTLENHFDFVKLVLKALHLLIVLLDILNKVLDSLGHITGRNDNGNNARYRTNVSMRELPAAMKNGVDITSRLTCTTDLHARPNDS